MDNKKLSKLNEKYESADKVDKDLFSEQRTNYLLYLGEHFSKNKAALGTLVRGVKSVPNSKKLRLVKNHIGIICDRLMHATAIGHNPDVIIEPAHKMEVQDKKAADISSGIWKNIKKENDFSELVSDWAQDFIVAGEMYAYVNFDPTKGSYLGTQAILNEAGMLVGEEPVFSGEVEIKKLDPFNVLRDPSSTSWKDCKWVIHRELVDVDKLRAQFGDGDEDKIKKITESSEEQFMILDTQRGTYREKQDNKVLLKKIFYKPCHKYPKGYYSFFTSDVVLAEGELNGLFPIVYRPYQKIPTSSRGWSIIKRLRPCQVEINRLASTIAESSIYHKDKLLISSGTKLSHGGQQAGVVGIKYSGQEPKIMEGRTGEKYLGVLSAQVSEMYNLANLSLEEEEKVPNVDPNALLYRSLKEKKKFSQKSDIYESFLIEVCELSIETARLFYSPEKNIINAIDSKDQISIPEFKGISKLSYSLNVKAMSADIETKLGEQVSIFHALQYAQSLDKEEIGTLLSNMPYLKDSAIAQLLTADNRAVEDVTAALERGEYPDVIPEDNHKYFIKRLSARKKESSYKFLDPFVHNLYERRLQEHRMFEAQNAQAIQRAQMGMIPAGGALITVSGLKDSEGNVVRIPYDALTFLIKKLDEQGSLMQGMQSIDNEGAIAQIADMTTQQPDQMQNAYPQMSSGGGINGY